MLLSLKELMGTQYTPKELQLLEEVQTNLYQSLVSMEPNYTISSTPMDISDPNAGLEVTLVVNLGTKNPALAMQTYQRDFTSTEIQILINKALDNGDLINTKGVEEAQAQLLLSTEYEPMAKVSINFVTKQPRWTPAIRATKAKLASEAQDQAGDTDEE